LASRRCYTAAAVRRTTVPAAPGKTEQKNPAVVSERTAWTFTTAVNSLPARKLTIRKLSDIRWTLFLEERSQTGSDRRRMFELGMTRDAAPLANAAAGQVQCVVTGRRGTIPVQHTGKACFVCCEGCRQAFEDDPAGILASHDERLEKEKQQVSPVKNKQESWF